MVSGAPPFFSHSLAHTGVSYKDLHRMLQPLFVVLVKGSLDPCAGTPQPSPELHDTQIRYVLSASLTLTRPATNPGTCR